MSPVRGGWAQVGWPDPAPGDAGAVRLLATRFQSRADDVRALNVELMQGVAGLEAWQGAAADGFRAAHQHLRHGLDEFVVQYERCVDGLTSYALRLEGLKHEADVLLPRVVAAQRRANDAQLPGLSPEAAYAFAQNQVKARGELIYLRGRHDGIARDHRGAVNACVDALEDSDGSTGLGRMFGDVKDVLGAAVHRMSQIDDGVTQWVHDNANTINAVSDVLGDLGTAVGFVALIPGPQQAVLGPLALGLSTLALTGHVVARASGADDPISNADLVWDGLGVGLGAGALGASLWAKHLKSGAEVARAAAATSRAQKADDAAQILDGLDKSMNYLGPSREAAKITEGEGLRKYWTPRDARGSNFFDGHLSGSRPRETVAP